MTDPIGKSRVADEPLVTSRAAALKAALGKNGSPLADGASLPPFWHHIYFWDAQPPELLGRDGHPKVGGFIPDTGLPRRMWAGGKLAFLAPLILGEQTTKTSTIQSVAQKTGRSGPLCLVQIEHAYTQSGTCCVKEFQDLVYLNDPIPDAPKPPPKMAPTDEEVSTSQSFDPVLLFRYSALTFNGHRIHYDREYCQSVEGYPGLVVHGPLLAQLLIHFAEEQIGALSGFEFRAMSPLFDFETAELCARNDGEKLSLWVRGPDGRLIMQASATGPH